MSNRDLTESLDDAHGDSRTGGFGLPDDVAAEMDAAFPNDGPTDDELEEEYMRWRAGERPADWYDDDDTDPPSGGGALFPEVVTWPDDHLIAAIDLCERRDPGLNLHAVGNLPDRHDAFLHAASAELVRRLDAREPGWSERAAA